MKNPYLTQLDGLRFIAVGLVLIDHWLAERNSLPLGPLGVNLFFVLSGFLISRILIESKQKDQHNGRSHWFSFKQFYIRRSLRIFPIYFLSILVLWLLHDSSVDGKISWYLLYATNIYIAIKQTWLGITDHFWSLAVEEQFYLFFPFFIFLTPLKHLPKLFVGLAMIAVLSRLSLFLWHTDWVVQYVSMPTSLDAFGVGAGLAYLFLFKKESFQKVQAPRFLWLSLLGYVLVVVSEKMCFATHRNFSTEVLERLLGSVFCFFLIAKSVGRFSGTMKWILENAISSYMGKISYGLYLYHNFVYNFYHTTPAHLSLRVLHKINGFLPFLQGNIVFELAYFFTITVILATISWFVIEKPINNLKRYFEY